MRCVWIAAVLSLAFTGCSDQLSVSNPDSAAPDRGMPTEGGAPDGVGPDQGNADGFQPADGPTPPADGPTSPADGPTSPADGPTPPADGPTPDAGPPPAPPKVMAYAYAHDPSKASYTALASYSFNSGGGSVSITRGSTGTYALSFSGASFNKSNVQVSAYSAPAGAICAVSSWGVSTVKVACYSQTGAKIDSRFTIAVFGRATGPSSANVIAYAWANNRSSASYTPTSTYSYNAAGGAITATRSGVGVYKITFANMKVTGRGNVQVSAYADPERCVIASWSGASVNVRCYDDAGKVADSRYVVAVIDTKPGQAKIGGWAWADKSTSPSYTPSATFSFNSGGGPITATRSTPGVYGVEWGGLPFTTGGAPMVTPYGTSNHCVLGSFGNRKVNVKCYNASGVPADARYNVIYLK
jgi:hypothetical protein